MNSNLNPLIDISANDIKSGQVNVGVLLDSFRSTHAPSSPTKFKFNFDSFTVQVYGKTITNLQTLSFTPSSFTVSQYADFAKKNMRIIFSLAGVPYSEKKYLTMDAYYKAVYDNIYKKVINELSNPNAAKSIAGWFDVNGENTRIPSGSMVTETESLIQRTRAGAMRDALADAQKSLGQAVRTFEAYQPNGWAGSQLNQLNYNDAPIYSFISLGSDRWGLNWNNSVYYDFVHFSACNVTSYANKTGGIASLTFGGGDIGATKAGTTVEQFDQMFSTGVYLALSMGVKSICEYLGSTGKWESAVTKNMQNIQKELNVVEKELGWAVANGNTLKAAGKSPLVPKSSTPSVASTFNNRVSTSPFYSNEFVGRDGSLYIMLANTQLHTSASVTINDQINASYQIASINGSATGSNITVSGGSFEFNLAEQSAAIIKFSAANLIQAMASVGSANSTGSISGHVNQLNTQSPILVGHA